MGYNNPLDTEDIIANTLMQESARREQYLATSTPQLSQAVGDIHRNYPALPAGVKLAMAKAGMTAQQIDAMYPTIANAQLRESVKEKPKKSWFERNVTDKIKTASRYTFAGMNLPLDFVQGGIAQIFDPNKSVAGWFISTDIGSLIANDEEAGSGFFIGGRAKELQAERARRYRGTIGGHAWTIGRGLASTIVDPNSKAFNYMSGALDAATALAVPTVPLAKGAKVALQEAEALGRGGAVVKGAVDVLEQFGRGSTDIRASRVTPEEIEAARRVVQGRNLQPQKVTPKRYVSLGNMWRKSIGEITPEQELAVARYTGGDFHYRAVQDELRFGNAADYLNEKQYGEIRQVIGGLDELFNRTQPLERPIVSYRAVVGEKGEAFLDEYRNANVGDIITEKAFASTTTDEKIAAARAARSGYDGLVLEVINPAGTRGIFTNAARRELTDETFLSESEFLLPRGTQFRVVEKTDNKIRVEVVSPDLDEIQKSKNSILVGGQVDFKAANRWFGTKQAQRVIERTAATDNFAEVWDLWGRKIDPDLALDLAKESDPDLIRVRLMDELGQAQGLTSTKNFRGGNKTYLSLTRRDQFLAKMPLGDRVSRAYAELPKRDINLLQAESPADKTAQLATLDSMLKLSLVDRQTQQGMLNRAAELLRSKSMPGIDEFNKDLEAVIRDAVENSGVDRGIVDAIFDNYKRVRDQAERFNIDENHEVADAGFYQKVVYGPPSPGSDQTFAGAQLASELAKNHFYFPDIRQIRRLTASKPVSWIFVKQGKAGDPNIDALRAAGQLRMPFAMIESFQEEIWRPIITATVGNFVRNTVDSQLMIALSHKPVSSLLRHPWQYVMAMRGDKRFADLFGRGFDEAPSANLLDDAQEAYRQATSNALNATYRDPVVPWQKARRIGHFDVRDKGLSKTTLGGRMSFARGHADEIGKLNADWATRTLASGRYDIDGVIALIKAGDKDATRWFNSMVEYYKGGRKTYNRATKEWGQVKVDLTDDFNLKALLEESQERLTRITGNNRQLLDVIAEGKLAEVVVDSRKVLTQGADIGQRVVYKVGRRNAMGEIVGIDPQTQGYLIRPFAFTKGEATLDLENLLLSPKIFDDPNMPTRVVGEVIDPTTPVNRQMKASFDRLIDMFHGYLYTQPIGKLERSPIFRELYYQWVDKLAVSLDSQSVDDIIADITNKAAAVRKKPTDYIDAKLWQKLQDIQAGKIRNYGTINRAELNAFVSGQVLDDMKMMFYNAVERRNATDGFRIISPFFQQQAEFLGRLGRLAFTPVAGGKLGYLPDPNVLRKGQLAVNGLTEADPDQNGRGFVYTDPVTGQWTFTFPASGQITKLLTGVESPINAPVKGISLGLDYRPGLGPMATIAVSKLLPDKPNTDFARNILLPYGERQGFSESFMPSWFRKVMDGIEGREGSTVFMNVYAETMQALAATGNYDTADPNDRDRLFNDARRKAQYLTILRGFSQFTGPAAGTLDQAVKAGELDAYASELAKAFQDMKENDYDTAVATFLDTFGDDAFIYMANKTKSVTGGLEASKEFGDFERTNEWLFRQYGEIAGYFGPIGSDFDFAVYQRQLSEGARKRLTPEEILESAEQTIAMSYYRTMRANFGTSLNAEERAYMGQYRRALQDRYPGYAKMVFDPQKLPRQIEQLGMAAQSDRLDGNPVAKAVRYYMQLRDQALTEAAARGRSGLSSNDTADLREYLSSYAQALVSQYPEFGRVYDRLLSKEIEQ